MKLINADALKERLGKLHLMAISGYGAEEYVARVVEELPDVVRCTDCQWWDDSPASTVMLNTHRCKHPTRLAARLFSDGNDYCSKGERKNV